MEMRKSKVLQKLRNGEIVSSFKMNLADSRVAEIVAMNGIDCIWTDMEHVPNDYAAIEGQVLASRAYDTDIIVRVPRGSYSDYVRPLEMNATGIMVPHIMSLQDAKNVVKMTRFFPIGLRPVDGGNADGAYCNIDMVDYLEQANRERLLIVQIEDPDPLAELDEIASLEGIDMLFFGPGDFSQAIGAPGCFDHPELVKARKLVAEAAADHGKFAGTVGSTENMDMLIGLGYRFINVGADVVGLNQYCKGLASRFAENVKKH